MGIAWPRVGTGPAGSGEKKKRKSRDGSHSRYLGGGEDSVVKESIESLAHVHRHERMNLTPRRLKESFLENEKQVLGRYVRAKTDLIVGKEVGTVKKVRETREYHAFHGLTNTRGEGNGPKVGEGGGLAGFWYEGDDGRGPFTREGASVPVFIHFGKKKFFIRIREVL